MQDQEIIKIINQIYWIESGDLKNRTLTSFAANIFQRRDVPQYSTEIYLKFVKCSKLYGIPITDILSKIRKDEKIVCPIGQFY